MAKKSKKGPLTTVVKRKDGRFAVKKRGGGYLNGDEKIKILVAEGKIKAPAVKAKPAEETPAEEAPAEEAPAETAEETPTAE
jgi:hypothetical protein